MGRKRGKNYFDETYMVYLLDIYRETKNSKAYEELFNGFDKIIYGMINSQFHYNSAILTYKNDVISECHFNILNALNSYDKNKGRLFSFVNQIVKNTLLLYTNKIRKLNIESLDETLSDYYNYNSNFDLNFNSNILNTKDSIYVIYNYLNDLHNIMQFYKTNDLELKKLVCKIKYDNFNNFDFNEFYTINDDDFILYKNIIDSIDSCLTNAISYIKTKYKKEFIDFSEPKSYSGRISYKIVGCLYTYFSSNKQRRYNNVKLYNINEVIEFIKFLIDSKRDLNYNTQE